MQAKGALMEVDENTAEAQSTELRSIFTEHSQFEDGMKVASSHKPPSHAYLLTDGFLFQVLKLRGKRSIVGVFVPGDLIGFSAIGSDCVGFDLVSAGGSVVARVGIQRLRSFVMTKPEFAMEVLSREGAIQRQWVANCQTLTAAQHMAHIFAELRHRLGFNLGKAPQMVRTPFRQTDLGDMCGVSAIHANRAVATLREAGIAEIRGGDLYTRDWGALEAYAKFESAYLREPQPLGMSRLSALRAFAARPLSAHHAQ